MSTPRPTIHQRQLDLTRLVAIDKQYPGSDRYTRFEYHDVFTSATLSVPFFLTNEALGGSATGLSFSYPRYGWMFATIDQAQAGDLGVEVASYTRIGTERAGMLTGALPAGWADAPYLASLVAYDTTGARVATPVECLAQFWIGVNLNGGLKNHPSAVLQNGNFDWMHPLEGRSDAAMFVWCVLPRTAYANSPTYPLTLPMPKAFSDTPPAGNLQLVPLVPSNGDSEMNVHTLCTAKDGSLTTANRQSYFVDDWIHPYSRLPQLDGPRGIGTLNFVTHLLHGHKFGVYAFDPWRWVRIDAQGNIKTLFGLRHKSAAYWEDLDDAVFRASVTETVGNWNASIPADECFPWECWGAAWLDATLPLDMFAMPDVDGNLPHKANPVLVCSDRHNYVLRVEFDGHSHDAPPTVTRFFPASDPWGLVAPDVIAVCERKRHAIAEYDATTGAHIRDVLVNPSGVLEGSVNDGYRRWQWNGVTNTTQAQAAIARCRAAYQLLAPEGLAFYRDENGDEWYVYGAYALGEIRRVNRKTGVVQVCARPYLGDITGNQPHYINVSVSDGTTGPLGTIFVTTFMQAQPIAYLPIPGTDTDGTPLTHSKQWAWVNLGYEVGGGDTGREDGFQYGMSVGLGRGMISAGSSNRGLSVHMLAPVPDPLDDTTEYTQIKAGALYWRLHGYDTLWGPRGYADHDVPLPWGEDANLDFTLVSWGHIDPAAVTPQPGTTGPTQADLDAANATIASLQKQLATLQAHETADEATITTLQGQLKAAQYNAMGLAQKIANAQAALA